MKWTNRFSTIRVGYSIGIALVFIIANTVMCSFSSMLVDKYICVTAINICFFCLFMLLIIRRRLEIKLPEYNYISYGKIFVIVLVEWVITIICGFTAVDFFAPFIILPIIGSLIFDDSLNYALSIYLIIISSLCFDYSSYMVICYITMVMFGGLISGFVKKGQAIQRLYALIILFLITTLVSIVFYYFNYLEINSAVLIYGLVEGVISSVVAIIVIPFFSEYIEKVQKVAYEDFLDPDYTLYNDIRKFSLIELQHSIRLSELSRKCANAINANEGLAACAGFYYRLGKIEGEPMIDNAIKIANNFCFPVDVIQILSEYGGIITLPSSKESAIVHMVDAVVTKVELFDSDSMSSSWNQNMVIYQTINELSQKGFYDNSGLTMNQFLIIREILANEDILA